MAAAERSIRRSEAEGTNESVAARDSAICSLVEWSELFRNALTSASRNTTGAVGLRLGQKHPVVASPDRDRSVRQYRAVSTADHGKPTRPTPGTFRSTQIPYFTEAERRARLSRSCVREVTSIFVNTFFR